MPQAGKTGGVLVDIYDFSVDLNQYNWQKNIAMVDVTTFPAAGSGAKDDRDFYPTLREGGISFQGVWNPAVDATDEELVALGFNQRVISASPQGFNNVGDRVQMVYGGLENYQPRSPVNDVVRFSVGTTASAGSYTGVVLHPHTQESSIGSFASVDRGVQTTQGGIGFLHVTQFAGTNATITIEDSVNDSVWGSLVAFSSVTGLASEKVNVAGNVERYTRINLTGTFTTITFAVSFSRNPV